MKRPGILSFGFGLFLIRERVAEWQWSVPASEAVAPETERHPQTFLWMPKGCMQVRAVMTGTRNIYEETLFENKPFRREMQEAGVALIWITPRERTPVDKKQETLSPHRTKRKQTTVFKPMDKPKKRDG